MDDFFTRLFRSAPSSIFSDISTNASLGSFLPHLQFMECSAQSSITPFSWDHMVQLYRQGHRRSLILTSDAYHSHITDETALQLLQLADEGVGLQIRDRRIDGDFLGIGCARIVFSLSTVQKLKQFPFVMQNVHAGRTRNLKKRQAGTIQAYISME